MSAALPPAAYIVDDDESIRTLWRWLMQSNGIEVRTFATAAEFIEAYRGGGGCLVLDVRMPGMSGTELHEYLKGRGIRIPVVFVTGHGDVPTAVSALKGGAVDFIQKPFDYREALLTVKKAFERDCDIRARRARRSGIDARVALLTERECEVLERVIAGKQNKLIAGELAISVKTVEVHRAKVMEKLGAASVAELVQFMLHRD